MRTTGIAGLLLFILFYFILWMRMKQTLVDGFKWGALQQKVSNKCYMHVFKPHVRSFIGQLEVIMRAYTD